MSPTSSRRPRPRRAGIRPTIGLVVEGDAEFAALPHLHKSGLLPDCPPMRPINLRGLGSDLTPMAVATRLVPPIIQHQVSGLPRVICCIDRENRESCAPEFAREVSRELVRLMERKNRSTANVSIVVADRAFEAWLLADAMGLHRQRVFVREPSFHCFEEQMGSGAKKGVVELDRLLGRPYRKSVDGPGLFVKLDLASARRHENGGRGSRSLDKFLRTIVG